MGRRLAPRRRIELSEPLQLAAAAEAPGIQKVGYLPPALGREIAEAQHSAVQQETHEARGVEGRTGVHGGARGPLGVP